MHLTEAISSRKAPFHTYEFFPPRTEAGLVNLLDRIRRLAAKPLPAPIAVSVTWGAGGATADRSLELAEHVVKMGLEVILHLTCTNMPKARVDEALEKCRSLGISNILALRGDPPRSDEYGFTVDVQADYFQHADDLVKYIRQEYKDTFCIGVAGYPTPHPDSETPESEMKWLKVKCDAGADFVITQLFYDMDAFEKWVKECRAAGITIPIIPGVMPIQNFSSFRRLVKLTGCPVPDTIMRDLEPISSDDAAVKRYGAQLATTMVSRLVSSGLVQGVHFCTLNLEKSVRTILENIGWTQGTSPAPKHNQLIGDESQDRSISPGNASQLAEWGMHQAQSPAPKRAAVGGGQSAEDSWDEYPNGRFTDVRSPAYGEIDGWGSGLKTTPHRALEEWGTPTGPEDLAKLFVGYLDSDPSTPTTPFCDLPLSPESATILPHLKALNSSSKQYWTVGSQPAVDSAPSEDPIVGWGPARGYVFQKAFVEFFIPSAEVEKIEGKLKARGDGQISLYASNKQGDFKTNTTNDAVNAVTWGVFPGQEIVQSTIIEETSFLAWKEEAFDIWTEWSQLYPKPSPARKLLEGVAQDWWLVSLIHHDYKDKDGLWQFLLE